MQFVFIFLLIRAWGCSEISADGRGGGLMRDRLLSPVIQCCSWVLGSEHCLHAHAGISAMIGGSRKLLTSGELGYSIFRSKAKDINS